MGRKCSFLEGLCLIFLWSSLLSVFGRGKNAVSHMYQAWKGSEAKREISAITNMGALLWEELRLTRKGLTLT